MSVAAVPLAAIPVSAKEPSTKITVHFMYRRRSKPYIDQREPSDLTHVPLGVYVADYFLGWQRSGHESDKKLVILEGTYTAEKMAEELNMQCSPVHDCIKFVVRDGRCIPIAT
jgi:hypothetical protein